MEIDHGRHSRRSVSVAPFRAVGDVVGALQRQAARVDELQVGARDGHLADGARSEAAVAEVASMVRRAGRADDDGREGVDAFCRERARHVAVAAHLRWQTTGVEKEVSLETWLDGEWFRAAHWTWQRAAKVKREGNFRKLAAVFCVQCFREGPQHVVWDIADCKIGTDEVIGRLSESRVEKRSWC